MNHLANMSEIVYPQGCRSVTEDLGPDELIRRLKVYLIHKYYHKYSLKKYNMKGNNR